MLRDALRRSSTAGRAALPGMLALLLSTGHLTGQALAPARGDTVRVTADHRAIYEIMAVRADTLELRAGADRFTVPLARVRRLEVGTRDRRTAGQRALRDGLIGFGIGTVAGGLGGGFLYGTEGAELDMPAIAILAYAGLGAAVGGALGLVIGAVRRPGWEWRAVDVEATRPATTMKPATGPDWSWPRDRRR